MLKIVLILAFLSVGCKMIAGRWPWQMLSTGKSTREQAVFRARSLLGVRAGATHAEITEAHKRLVTMVHPDKGGQNAQVHEANAARDVLLNELPDRR
ncbi:J domain-containing protein [Altererythrobacter sp. ZODW24]|uniref:J domain-containing protein n=1 Tax=Altererythrobacter sp. ZODW24 TaxID=2185142 RepID=UPI000DF7B4A1|nr:J domain-containing protein [Altererythrobacter sp. ZODW24]